jgi:8-oxo-dGTP pyrophosphatase MutT (NUDIX family)
MERATTNTSGNSSRSFHSAEDPKQYRAFVFCIHDIYGALLLHCTRKQPMKPPHFQIPGGHVDAVDHDAAAEECSLQRAGQVGAARELQEETGIQVDPDRILPLQLYTTDMGEHLNNEFKHRLFYRVRLTDDDFPKEGYIAPMESSGPHAHVKVRYRRPFSLLPEFISLLPFLTRLYDASCDCRRNIPASPFDP